MIGFVDTLCTVLGTTDNCNATAILHTSQFTVTHALGFSVFNSRLLAMDLQQSPCHFTSHMKSSLHRLIPFLPLFCNCQLNSISLLPSSYPGWLESRNSTQFYAATASFGTLLYNRFARITQKTQPLYYLERKLLDRCFRIRCRGNLFTESLRSNERLFWLRCSGFGASYHNMSKFIR
jgi:hypothetical protein